MPPAASCSRSTGSNATIWRSCKAFPIHPAARSRRAFRRAIASGRRKLVDDDDAGLDAATDYRVRERLNGAALLELRLHTGRQHQIRLHLEKLGHPLIGERVYAAQAPSPPPSPRLPPPQATRRQVGGHAPVSAKRNMLHAWTLAFPHPLTAKPIAVEAPLPARTFFAAMKRLALRSLLPHTLFARRVRVRAIQTRHVARRPPADHGDPRDGAITIDGVLDEEVWSARRTGQRISFRPIRSKGSRRPKSPKCASPTTTTISTSRRSAATPTPSGIVVNEIRKDFAGRDQDTFEVLLDTFADRRNGFVFSTNAEGAKADTQIANEGRDVNPNWDAVWWVESRTTADGWIAEFRIPFKTLRFEAGDGQTLGHQLRAPRPAQERNQLLVAGVARLLDLSRVGGRRSRPACRRCGRAATCASSRFSLGGAVRGVGERELRSRISAPASTSRPASRRR